MTTKGEGFQLSDCDLSNGSTDFARLQIEETLALRDQELAETGGKGHRIRQPFDMSKGACNGPGMIMLFAPPSGHEKKQDRLEREKKAKAICDTCDLLRPCLDQALAGNDQFTILGGTSPIERGTIRRKRYERERFNRQQR